MTQSWKNFLHVEQAGPIVSVLLHRPERRNALTRAMWVALRELVEDLDARRDVRLTVLASSTPGIFSSGADVKEYRDHVSDPDWTEESRRVAIATMDAVADMSVPTLAVIDGACSGGGVGLAVSCDMRIATPRSTFAVKAARLGTVYPFSGTLSLVDLVGTGNAKRMLFTGATFDAGEAAAMGLVDEIVEESRVEAAVDTLADALAATSRTSVRLMKRTIRLVASGQRTPDDVTDALVREALHSKDYHEGVSAFLERRPPAFED